MKNLYLQFGNMAPAELPSLSKSPNNPTHHVCVFKALLQTSYSCQEHAIKCPDIGHRMIVGCVSSLVGCVTSLVGYVTSLVGCVSKSATMRSQSWLKLAVLFETFISTICLVYACKNASKTPMKQLQRECAMHALLFFSFQDCNT